MHRQQKGEIGADLARVFALATVAASLIVPAQAQLQPELVFRDTYDVSEPTTDLNFERAARQSGKVAPLTYSRAGGEINVQLNAFDAPGKLRVAGGGYASPNHNFTEGGQFTIEFDVDPGIDDDPSDGLSGDWCAIVFGATSQNVFVNSSDGLGILFRNNGNIEVWETAGQGSIYSGPAEIPGGLPTDRPFHVRIDVNAADFKGSPATVRMYVDDKPVRINRNTVEHVKQTGFRGNFITLEGLGNWVHTFDNLTVRSVPCVGVSPSFVDSVIGQTSAPLTVTIPAQMNTGKTAQVTVTSLNPAVAVPSGADANGKLVLNYAANGDVNQTFTLQALRAGTTTLQLTSEGVCVSGSVQVNVAAGVGLAEVVLEDNFQTSEYSWDINFEAATRQKGSAAPINYTESAASAAGGAADEFTQINNPEFPGKLYIFDPAGGVSPNYNFIDGPNFTIEFEVEPGANNPWRDSDNWAAIVFGASSRNLFVNAGDGMGILFRNDGRIEVWDGNARVYGSEFADALPAGPLNVRIESSTANFRGTTPASIRMWVNDQPVKISPSGFEHVKAAGFRGNYITLLGYGAGMLHTFDSLKVTSEACVVAQSSTLNFGPADTSLPLTIKIPQAMNRGTSATVTLRSSNPSAASFEGSNNGELTLTFAANGPTTQTVNVVPTGKGRALLEISNSAGVCVGDPVVVNIATALVKNPSFEQNYNAAWPHYGSIAQWPHTGGVGVNRASGPFHDNGKIPDRNQVAFLQANASISQTITGLIPGKQYWVQVRYNARGCCGGATPDLAIRFDGQDLDLIQGIRPVGGANEYYFRNAMFVATASSGILEFAGSAAGDATTLLDAVTIVQRDEGNVLVHNPSFEASGEPAAPGYIQPNSISGWAGTGNYGVNFSGAGPFADNGTAPDQDYVAFIQGQGSLSQRIGGLVQGEQYTLTYSYNARSGNQPILRVSLGEAVLHEQTVSPVGGSAVYHRRSVNFTAADASAVLTFAQVAEGDHTLLLDNISITGRALVIPPIKVSPISFDLNVIQTDSGVTLVLPPQLTASSPATITITSQNPAVAIPTGAVDGKLDLVFAVGETEKTFTIAPVGVGSTRFQLSNRLGAQFDNESVQVSVTSSFVRNPSFEANSHPTFPGYGDINGWSSSGPGNTGLNNSGGPFHDNGTIPDRAQVALIQTEKSITQQIFGLIPGKTYWLQFYYNTRNCCGGSIDLSARLDGVDLVAIPSITPVGGSAPYHFQQLEFVATAPTAQLEFATASFGDATALLDAVSIVQRDTGEVVLQNPSFEASGVVGFPGYIQPNKIAGWTSTGNYGVNVSGVGPFADNGRNRDQDNVLFIQGQDSSSSQLVTGLTPGQIYTLAYDYNARGGNTPTLKVTIGSVTAQDEAVSPVGGTNPYHRRTFSFVAEADSALLKFTQTAAGDQTVLIDNVSVRVGGSAPEVRLRAEQGAGGTIRLTWPASAQGYVLQFKNDILGQWSTSAAPEMLEGDQKVVTDSLVGTTRFYRLVKP